MSTAAHSLQQGPQQQQQQQAARHWDSSVTPRFQTIKFLGKGGQGFVQLAYDNLHKQQVAIKYIDRGWSRGFYKYVLRETLNHQQLSLCKHPHIVEFHEVFLTPSYLAVVMEYVNGTNLQHYLEAAGGKLPEDVVRFIFQQLIIAVDFCHKKGKVNRDIKLANILLQEGHLPLVKLCDFGFSKDKFDDSEPQTQIGTALFTAPEIFTNVPGQVYDAEAADLWSCGVVLFVMLFGCHPFLSMDDTQHRKHAQVMKLIENAVKGHVQVPPGAEAQHPQALDLIRRILVSAPGQRCKLPDIMSHPWFQDKLPPGALLLNAAYLAIDHPVGELRQTQEEVHSIITAALSTSPQPEASEATSVGPKGDAAATATSDGSRPFPSHQPLSPQGQHAPPPPLPPQDSVGAPPGIAPVRQTSGDTVQQYQYGHPPASPHGSTGHPGLPAQPPVLHHMQQQHQQLPPQAHHAPVLTPQHTQHAQHVPTYRQVPPQQAIHAQHPQRAQQAQHLQAHLRLQPGRPSGDMGGGLPQQQPMQAPNGSASATPHSYMSAPGAAAPGPPGVAGPMRQGSLPSAAFHPHASAGVAADAGMHARGGSPSPMGGQAPGRGVGDVHSQANGGFRSGMAGPMQHGAAVAADPPPPPARTTAEAAAAHRVGGPSAMDVSGCILYDSSLLLAMDLQAED